jgi:osmotically-inducible protein OsmY
MALVTPQRADYDPARTKNFPWFSDVTVLQQLDTVAGVVTLSGHVPSPDAAARAEQLARQTEGVREVNNKLRVS